MGTYYCVKRPGECDGKCDICPVGPIKPRSAQEDDAPYYSSNENPDYDTQLELFSDEEMGVKSDAVIQPSHYTKWKIEPITFIMRNDMPFWMGNVIKYVMRSDSKNGIEDLRKAKRYIEFRIRQLQGEVDITR